MIKTLQSSSPNGISVSYHNTPHINNSGQGAGQLRYNVSTQNIEVYDGINWIMLSQHVTVGFDGNAEEVLRWAGEKMYEEKALKAKMEKYPTLKSAYEQYKMVEALVYEDENGV
jgi:hypothetical protein